MSLSNSGIKLHAIPGNALIALSLFGVLGVPDHTSPSPLQLCSLLVSSQAKSPLAVHPLQEDLPATLFTIYVLLQR